MKPVIRFIQSLCVFYVVFLVVASGVFAGMQMHDYSQNHVLLEFRQILRSEDKLPSGAIQVAVSKISPLHNPEKYHLYMVAEAYRRDSKGDLKPTKWTEEVQEGTNFRMRESPEGLWVDWRFVCSKEPLATYQEVIQRDLYSRNWLLISPWQPTGPAGARM